MKKISLFVAILLVIGLASFTYAEMSATGMNGKNFREQQVFVEAYNSSGTSISSNWVVIIDTTASAITSGSTLGAYITTTTTTGSALVLGVSDETIAASSVGRICVRGPHKVRLVSAGTLAAGATVGTTATAGWSSNMKYAGTDVAVFGSLLSTTDVQLTGEGLIPGEPPTGLYWVWIGGAAK